eukprot:660172-Lingulodinium_polyedra.AAC.1
MPIFLTRSSPGLSLARTTYAGQPPAWPDCARDAVLPPSWRRRSAYRRISGRRRSSVSDANLGTRFFTPPLCLYRHAR